jgi:hypothetical protein
MPPAQQTILYEVGYVLEPVWPVYRREKSLPLLGIETLFPSLPAHSYQYGKIKNDFKTNKFCKCEQLNLIHFYNKSVTGRCSECGRMITMQGMQNVHLPLMLLVLLILTNHLKLRPSRARRKKTTQSIGHRIRAIQKICASYGLIRFCWLPWKRDHMTLHKSQHQIHLH